jgi:hypothetical protein
VQVKLNAFWLANIGDLTAIEIRELAYARTFLEMAVVSLGADESMRETEVCQSCPAVHPRPSIEEGMMWDGLTRGTWRRGGDLHRRPRPSIEEGM